MKQLIVFWVLLLTYNAVLAEDDCDCSHPTIQNDSSIGFISSLSKELNERQTKRLSGKLCRALTNFNIDEHEESLGEKIEEYLLTSSGIDKSSPNYKKQLANFWNKNSNKIICKENFESTLPKQHFFSRAVQQNFSTLVLKDYFFSDHVNFPIDPNVVVTNQYGKEETVIDYIDRILSHPDAERRFNTDQIIKVRDIIKNRFKGIKASSV